MPKNTHTLPATHTRSQHLQTDNDKEEQTRPHTHSRTHTGTDKAPCCYRQNVHDGYKMSVSIFTHLIRLVSCYLLWRGRADTYISLLYSQQTRQIDLAALCYYLLFLSFPLVRAVLHLFSSHILFVVGTIYMFSCILIPVCFIYCLLHRWFVIDSASSPPFVFFPKYRARNKSVRTMLASFFLFIWFC